MKVSKGTLTRTIVLILALVNQLLAAYGKSPIPLDDEAVTDLISSIFTAGAALAAWWKNNDFTSAAMEGTAYMKRLKTERRQAENDSKQA